MRNKNVSLESFVMRSRKSDSMELQRKSCLYLFFSIEKVTSLRSTILGVSPSRSRLYPKNKRYIFIRVSLIRKRKTPLHPEFCFLFFPDCLCIFDKYPNFNNLGFNSEFIMIALTQLIRLSRFLFSSSAVYLVFVIIFH